MVIKTYLYAVVGTNLSRETGQESLLACCSVSPDLCKHYGLGRREKLMANTINGLEKEDRKKEAYSVLVRMLL